MPGHRNFVFAFLAALFLVTFLYHSKAITSTVGSYVPKNATPSFFDRKKDQNALSPHVNDYFEQVWSVDKPKRFPFNALKEQCRRTQWYPAEDQVFIQCGGMAAGLTSIISQVKVCIKMAIEAGVGIILPKMPLRSSETLTEFNFLNPDAYMALDEWFDGAHFIESLTRACPQMYIIHPDQIKSKKFEVKNGWSIDIGKAPGYVQFQSYFWPGRPFKPYFDKQYASLKELADIAASESNQTETTEAGEEKKGLTSIEIASRFLVFRIIEDPTNFEREVWAELSHLLRFKDSPRLITHRLLERLNRPWFGVHFRAEADTIWSSPDHQLQVDLDALDQAWAQYGTPGAQKPLVYLACGDQKQVETFVAAGKERGWEVTHKWALAQTSPEAIKMINELPFDFQGAVDMGIMMKGSFFFGIDGSAFSWTVANARDVTGRYRGSSFVVYDDGNARTHLFNDGGSDGYPCCL